MRRKVLHVPVLPARLCQVVQATQDPDASMTKIVKLVSSDPGLSLELLRIANSAYYSPRRKILSVAQAGVFLGLRAVRHHAVSHVLKAVIDQVDLSGIDEWRLWRSIVYRGAAAHVLAELLRYEDPTEAFTTGVIMDAGFVMLVALRPELSEELEEASRLPGQARLDRERELTGTTHPEIFGEHAREWGLPEALVSPIEAHHDEETRLLDPRTQRLWRVIHLADHLLDARSGDKAGFLKARRLAPGLGAFELKQLLERVEAELPRLGDLVNAPKVHRPRSELMRDAVAAMDGLQREILDHNRELKAQNAELDRAASQDPLTGVANRRAFTRNLATALDRGVATLVMFDLDHFKSVNDTHGHGVGDDVLVGVCRRIEATLEDGECLGRLGGEEFGVLVPTGDVDEAVDRAEVFRRALADEPMACRDGVVLEVTGSFGGVTAAGCADALYAEADGALYKSKRSGRNRVSWSDAGLGRYRATATG